MYLHFICTSTSSSSNIIVLLAFSSTCLQMLASHVKHEDWHQGWKIFYVHCFRPFSKKNKTKRKSATNPPQQIHIPLLCFFVWFIFFLCCYFFVAAFTLLAPFQLGLKIFTAFFMCICLILFSFHIYSLSYFPVLHIPTPLFCARSRGTEPISQAHLLEHILCALYQARFKKEP